MGVNCSSALDADEVRLLLGEAGLGNDKEKGKSSSVPPQSALEGLQPSLQAPPTLAPSSLLVSSASSAIFSLEPTTSAFPAAGTRKAFPSSPPKTTTTKKVYPKGKSKSSKSGPPKHEKTKMKKKLSGKTLPKHRKAGKQRSKAKKTGKSSGQSSPEGKKTQTGKGNAALPKTSEKYKLNSAFFASPSRFPSVPKTTTTKTSTPPPTTTKESPLSSPSLSLPGQVRTEWREELPEELSKINFNSRAEGHTKSLRSLKSSSQRSIRSVGKWTALEDDDENGEKEDRRTPILGHSTKDSRSGAGAQDEKEIPKEKVKDEVGHCTLLKDPDELA